MQVVRKIHSDVTAVFRTTPKQSKEASPKERLERARAAASEKAPSKGVTRHHQMPAEEQRSGGHALWCARRPDVPP